MACHKKFYLIGVFLLLYICGCNNRNNSALSKYGLNPNNLVNVKLHSMILKGIDLSNKDMHGSDFSYCDFSGTDFTGTNLKGTILISTVFGPYKRNGKWVPTMVRNANFEDADLTSATLIFCRLDNTKFNHAKLDKLYMNHKNINGDFLSRPVITNVEFRYASIKDAVFCGDIKNSDFSYADFTDTKFYGGITHSNFAGCVFRNADLSKALLFGKSNFKNSIYNKATKWPDGFNPVSAGAILVK